MIYTRATIIRIEGGDAIVRAAQGGSCGACGNQDSCGSAKLSEAMNVRPRHFRIRNETDASVGDEVQIAVPDGALLRSAIILYALPLALLFTGAVIGKYLFAGVVSPDVATGMGAGCGVVAGFLLARLMATRQRRRAEGMPEVL